MAGAQDFRAFMQGLLPDYYWCRSPIGSGTVGDRPSEKAIAEDNSGATFEGINDRVDTDDAALQGDFTWVSPATDDAIYVGGHESSWRTVLWNLPGTSQLGASATITWEFWNGATWAALPGVTDGTSSLKTNSTTASLTFTAPTGWAVTDIDGDGIDLFYIRGRLSSGTYTFGPEIRQIVIRIGDLFGFPNVGIGPAPGTLSFEQQFTASSSSWEAGPVSSWLRADTNATTFPAAEESDSIMFDDADIPNTDSIVRFGPIDFQDSFGISFGYFFDMGYRDHTDDTVDGSFPDQLGFGVRLNAKYGAGGDTEAEILFSVVDEQDRTSELGPYLTVTLFENKEASPDNRGLPTVGEIFTMTDPATSGDPWRWEYRDLTPTAVGGSYEYHENDRTSRIQFIGFSLSRNFLGDGTEFWKCSFYQNGRFTTVAAQVPEVPHEIMHQTNNPSFLWNMYDDGTGEPFIERTSPHYCMAPFIFKKALSQGEWDTIWDAACRQTYGVSGYFDVVTAAAPPVRVLHHTSTNLGNQVRSLHHTHSNSGNARFVPPVITKRFRLTITGTPDATTDVQLPMKSFSVAKSLAETQTVSFQIPFRDEIIEALNDRPNGLIKLEFSLEDTDGVPTGFTEYLMADQGDSVVSQGPFNQAVSLNGDYIVPNRVDASFTVPRDEIVRESVEGGVIALTIKFNEAILPGDTINWTNPEGAQSFVVRTVQLNATTGGGCVMTLQEDSGSG